VSLPHPDSCSSFPSRPTVVGPTFGRPLCQIVRRQNSGDRKSIHFGQVKRRAVLTGYADRCSRRDVVDFDGKDSAPSRFTPRVDFEKRTTWEGQRPDDVVLSTAFFAEQQVHLDSATCVCGPVEAGRSPVYTTRAGFIEEIRVQERCDTEAVCGKGATCVS